MGSVATDINFSRLNTMLWSYRQTLDRFAFLLEMQLVVVRDGRHDWQHHLADLIGETADAVAELDIEREVLLGPVSLGELAAAAPDPWKEIMAEQHRALQASAAALAQLKERNQQVAAAGSAGITQLLDALVDRDNPDSYDETGKLANDRQSRNKGAALFDGRA